MDLDAFRPRIREILRNADLDSITPKQIRDTLQLETKVDLLGYKKALKPIIEECYDEVAKEKALADAISDDSESDPEGETRKPAASPVVDQSPAKKSKKEEQPKKRTRQPKNDKPKKKRVIDPEKRESNNFTRTWILDDMLAEVTGQKALPRPQIVKHLWEYIKGNNLQDPQNKTMIKCDEKLTKLFEGETYISSFKMQKYIGKHIVGPAVPDQKTEDAEAKE